MRHPMICRNKVDFIITGSQTSGIKPDDVNKTHFALVNDYDISRNKLYGYGPIKPSSESMTDAALYECDKNIQCVVHIHKSEQDNGQITNNRCISKIWNTRDCYGDQKIME